MGFSLPLVVRHLVLIPNVFNVILKLLQDTLEDQFFPSEWQLSLPPNFGFCFYISLTSLTHESQYYSMVQTAD